MYIKNIINNYLFLYDQQVFYLNYHPQYGWVTFKKNSQPHPQKPATDQPPLTSYVCSRRRHHYSSADSRAHMLRCKTHVTRSTTGDTVTATYN